MLGRTVPSYRIALEWEIESWRVFAEALSPKDREAFEVLMDACRNHSTAGGCACKPILFEPMIMSILLSHENELLENENKIVELEEKLHVLFAKREGLVVKEES